MSTIRAQISVSLDGFAAGPGPSLEHPLGRGGEQLHRWAFPADGRPREGGVDAEVVQRLLGGLGAHVMGRGMFGGGDGAWDASWRGWWGEDPPYHGPVFVLTHHPREPLEMQGGTTFTFVTDGLEAAVARARDAAAGADVSIAGGASVVQQALRAGLLDRLELHVVPVVLGGGRRLLDDVGDVAFAQEDAVAGEGVVHLALRVVR